MDNCVKRERGVISSTAHERIHECAEWLKRASVDANGEPVKSTQDCIDAIATFLVPEQQKSAEIAVADAVEDGGAELQVKQEIDTAV